jgi:hypothetical protein
MRPLGSSTMYCLAPAPRTHKATLLRSVLQLPLPAAHGHMHPCWHPKRRAWVSAVLSSTSCGDTLPNCARCWQRLCTTFAACAARFQLTT